jgi:hypothetical protein
MEQIAEQPARKRGIIRRLVGAMQGEDDLDPGAYGSLDFIDLADTSSERLVERIERLEQGARLLAETMKQSHGRLTAALEDLHRQTARAASVEEVRRLVADALARVERVGGRPVVPVVPFEARGPHERVDTLTALRRDRFSSEETDGSPGGVEGAP